MKQFRVGDWVVLNGPSVYEGARGRLIKSYGRGRDDLWYVNIDGKKMLFNEYYIEHDKKATIKAFYEQVLLLDRGEGK